VSKGIWTASTQVGFSDIPGQITLDVFTVGCSLHCKDCHTPELQDPKMKGRILLKGSKLAQRVLEGENFYSAVCWMGGEPTEQEEALAAVVGEAREASKLPHMLFTGHLFDQIPDSLLQLFSIIKAGPWQGIPVYHPDSNQKLYVKSACNWREVGLEELIRYVEEGI